jgi:S1-C subfamily serine protease
VDASDVRSEVDALDGYSRIVASVAERLLPSVASLQLRRSTPRGRMPAGAGSAVAITDDGFLLTSAHVVSAGRGGIAALADGREASFQLVGADPLSDLALVRVPAPLDPATLGDADALRVGQLVVAVGSPLGYSGSVTAGVVSGLGRSFPAGDGRSVRIVENVIQTDAALHPGNSGGALADASAAVVGINTAVVGPGLGQGLGLAVPLNGATQRIIAQLMTDGRVRRAYLGVSGAPRPLPPRAAASTGRETGIEVLEVMPGSPAARAGIRPEDILVELDDEPLRDFGDLQRTMDAERIDRSSNLILVRTGEVHRMTVTPTELSSRS